jgi:hypothetical protein
MSIPEYPDNEEELRKVYAAELAEYQRAKDQIETLITSKSIFYGLSITKWYHTNLPHAQDLWLTYRAAMVRLLAAARPDINPENVKRLITEKRIQYLHDPWYDTKSLL